MPRVSIVMPTYNRGDSIGRAIKSILAQTFEDWELVVVDDGSTDDTASRIAGLDPRLRVLRQENQGVTAARNTALADVKGELVAFLDSDDEWVPHHLALATSFFDTHPDEHLFSGEFWEDFGTGTYTKHFRAETGVFAPNVARAIRSHAFDTPPRYGDPYLWFYDSRAAVGDWARRALEKTPYANALEYRGHIFHGWRWEFLLSMQSTVLTRTALANVGVPDPKYRVASDYEWLARLCRAYAINMVNVPSTIKHEYNEGKKPLAEGHLVTGKTAVRFHEDMLGMFDEMFFREAPDDPELRGIRAYRHLKIAEAAMLFGQRDLAREHLEQAVDGYRGASARALLWLSRLAPSGALAKEVYAQTRRASSLARRVARKLTGESAVGDVVAVDTSDLEIETVRSRTELARWAESIDAVNRAARRSTPFASFAFLDAYLAHDEFAQPGDEPLVLLALRGGRLVGYLPLRKTTRHAGKIPFGTIECLALGYRDRPGTIASADDEAASSAAFLHHLTHDEPGWGLVELASQDAESSLSATLSTIRGPRVWARRYDNDPTTVIPLPYESIGAYFESLEHDFRKKVTKRARRLCRAGRVEFLVSSDPAALDAMLDLYIDVERRSWKAAAKAGVARHPERVALVREMCRRLPTVFMLLAIDGVVVAGQFALEHEGVWFVLETVYDTAYGELSPGWLIQLLGIGEAIERRQRDYNLLHAFAYYKLSWNGVATPTAAVQIYRVPSVPYVKARAGELTRRARAARGAAEVEAVDGAEGETGAEGDTGFNPAKRAVADEPEAGAADRPPRDDEKKLLTEALRRLESVGARVKVLEGASLAAALPFSLQAAKRGKPGGPKQGPKAPGPTPRRSAPE